VPLWINIPRRRSILAVLIFALVAQAALALRSAHQDPPSPSPREPTSPQGLPTLTTLREAHSLLLDEARRGYPIHVRAVVTYCDYYLDTRRVALFLHDDTGGMYAAVALGTTWSGRAPLPGTLVDVTGIVAPGDFAPIIDQAHVTVLGDAPLPARAKLVTLPELLTGVDDGQWLEIEGVVRAVIQSDVNVTLRIAMTDGTISAMTVKRADIDYRHLVDTWVHIRGNAGPIFNVNRQMTGVRLFFPGPEVITSQPPSPADAFDRPVQPINSLLRYNPRASWPHRVHVRGTVTLNWPGRSICIKDQTDALCAQTAQDTPVGIGSTIDLIGFTALAGLKPVFEDAVFHAIPGRPAGIAIAPSPITPEQALRGKYDSRLVQIDGRLIGRDLSADDVTLLLFSDKSVFRVILPGAQANPAIAAIPTGSMLRVAGICSIQVDVQETLKSFGVVRASQFSILLPSPQNLIVLQTPSWWTTARIGLALLFTLAITLAGFFWVIVLRRRVEQQTRELRESRELYRHMAHHDTLTGLPTRALMHDDLQIGLERSRRFKKGLALLMLDLDNFKQVNDSFGHHGGDIVLRITANRLSSIVRKTDSVARMGGDEFIVLLNDLVAPGQAELVAAKIVAALSLPVQIGKFQVPISVSVGVCTLSEEDVDAELLLKRVDAAMYRAKQSGRGCFQVFTADMLAHIPHPSGIPSSPSAQTTLVST